MPNIFSKAWDTFLTVFGDIKVSKWPMWAIYDPEYFKMPGKELTKILENLQEGDVILRGYDCYADGYFIPEVEGHGRYSHAGLYVGDGQIIHAVAPTVALIDALEFMECDRIAVLRPTYGIGLAVVKAKSYLDAEVGYDFNFEVGDKSLYCYELCAECYKGLQISRMDASILCGLVKKKNCYLASSFFASPDFKLVYECNPKKSILVDNF